MFAKCLNVIAKPAAMAGRYNRSRQFNLGRETVIGIVSNLRTSPGLRLNRLLLVLWIPDS
jgi:hypothetical protein